MKLFSSRGFTLIEMLVGAAIASIAALTFASAVLAIKAESTTLGGAMARGDLVLQLRRTILDRRALAVTVQNNPVMKAIVTNDFSGPITTVTSGEAYGIDVFDSSNNRIAGAAMDTSTHPVATPVYYTTEGFPCSTPGVHQCDISVTASFIIQGHPQFGTYHNLVPTPQYPAWNAKLRPDFMLISYFITFNNSMPGVVHRPIRSSIFFSFDDFGI